MEDNTKICYRNKTCGLGINGGIFVSTMITLKMEAVPSSEMLVTTYVTTRGHNSKCAAVETFDL